MHILDSTHYRFFVLISIFFFGLNSAHSDELDIFISAIAKNYCSCIFVSNLNPLQCSEMLNNLVSATTENNSLIDKVSNEMDVNIDANLNQVIVTFDDRGIKSTFNGRKGCFLDNL